MNGKSATELPGVTRPAHELLALVFNTPERKKRLRRVLGCSMSELYKKLAGERGNPLSGSADILALAIDLDREERTSLSRHVADYLPTVRRLRAESPPSAEARDWRGQANELLREGTEAVCSLNVLDEDERDLPDLAAAIQEAAQLEEMARTVRRDLEERAVAVARRGATAQKSRAATPLRGDGRSTNRQLTK